MRIAVILMVYLLMSATVPSDPETHKKEVEDWRAHRYSRLKADDGWLTLVGLFWLQEGDNSFGSGASNKVVFPKGPATAGIFKLHNGVVTLEADPSAGITSDSKPVKTLDLTPDTKQNPTVLDMGSLRFLVIDRMGKLGIRLKDRDNPLRQKFHGIDSFPVEEKWRINGRFEPYKPEKKIPIPNILNMIEDTPSPCALVFKIDGKEYRLDAVIEAGETDYFIIFGDQTNGKETYGAGRFLYVTAAGPDGKVVIDFNKAYNPPCVFSHYATCPLPPKQNKLAVRIEAGEKKFVAPE